MSPEMAGVMIQEPTIPANLPQATASAPTLTGRPQKPLVLLLSSMDTPEFEEQMIRAGADYMLIKPVRPQSVAHRISRLSQWKAKSKNPRSADVQGADLDLIISDIMRQIGVLPTLRAISTCARPSSCQWKTRR